MGFLKSKLPKKPVNIGFFERKKFLQRKNTDIIEVFESDGIVIDCLIADVVDNVVTNYFLLTLTSMYAKINCVRLSITMKGDTVMDLISSFAVDHTAIVPGIFISRQDKVSDGMVTTYDIRLKRPNREPTIDVAAMHSLEHLIATFLRNEPDWKDEVIYWGPMGCLTGFYLILKGNRLPQEVYELILRAFQSVKDADSVPGATAKNCGHYLMHNLEMAKWYAAEFADYLVSNFGKPEIFEYPKTERLITDDGHQFYDS